MMTMKGGSRVFCCCCSNLLSSSERRSSCKWIDSGGYTRKNRAGKYQVVSDAGLVCFQD